MATPTWSTATRACASTCIRQKYQIFLGFFSQIGGFFHGHLRMALLNLLQYTHGCFCQWFIGRENISSVGSVHRISCDYTDIYSVNIQTIIFFNCPFLSHVENASLGCGSILYPFGLFGRMWEMKLWNAECLCEVCLSGPVHELHRTSHHFVWALQTAAQRDEWLHKWRKINLEHKLWQAKNWDQLGLLSRSFPSTCRPGGRDFSCSWKEYDWMILLDWFQWSFALSGVSSCVFLSVLASHRHFQHPPADTKVFRSHRSDPSCSSTKDLDWFILDGFHEKWYIYI